MDEEYESAIMEIDEMPIGHSECYESSRKKIDKVLRELKRKRKKDSFTESVNFFFLCSNLIQLSHIRFPVLFCPFLIMKGFPQREHTTSATINLSSLDSGINDN